MIKDNNIIDLSEENIGHEEKADWRDFPTRNRNARIITLCEGDILVDGDTYSHVAEGEVDVYADGAVNTSRGELVEVSIEGVQEAIAEGKTIFNLEDTNA